METDPVDDVALAPFGHREKAGVPVCPDVLLRGDGSVLGQRLQDLGIGARVVAVNIAKLRSMFFRDLEFGCRHVRV